MDKEINRCEECGSEYYAASSLMKSLCPECAHALYGYPNCSHVFDNGRCILCYWDGSRTKFTEQVEKPAVTYIDEARQLMQTGRFKDAMKILNGLDANDKGTPAALLLTILCSYQVSTTRELLDKVSSNIDSVKFLTRRADLNRLSGLCQLQENGLVNHMIEYSMLSLLLSGKTLVELIIEFKPPKVSTRNKSSSFAKMDQEDVHNFRRTRALNEAQEPYDFDAIEEMDDIGFKFRATLNNPDKSAVDVLKAGAGLAFDIGTFFARADAYYNPEDSRYYHNVRVDAYDYGTNVVKGKEKLHEESYRPSPKEESSHSVVRKDLIPETTEERLARQHELLQLILEEEQMLLS